MERKEFLEKVLAYGRQAGFADCEVYYRGGKAFEVLILEGEVSDYENSREEGLAFRGNINGRTGYAYTEQLTEDAIAYLVETAKENAALLSPEDCEELYAGEESYPELEGVNAALEELRVEEKINAAMRMETAALAGAEEVASLDYCALGTSLAEVVIRNTRGLDVSFAKNFATAYVSFLSVSFFSSDRISFILWHSSSVSPTFSNCSAAVSILPVSIPISTIWLFSIWFII